MKLYNEFYDVPEVANMPVAEARKLWKDMRTSPFFSALGLGALFVVLCLAATRQMFPQAEGSLSTFSGAMIGTLLAQYLTRLVQIAKFRRCFREHPQK